MLSGEDIFFLNVWFGTNWSIKDEKNQWLLCLRRAFVFCFSVLNDWENEKWIAWEPEGSEKEQSEEKMQARGDSRKSANRNPSGAHKFRPLIIRSFFASCPAKVPGKFNAGSPHTGNFLCTLLLCFLGSIIHKDAKDNDFPSLSDEKLHLVH